MNMRTTISLDERLAEDVRRRAAEQGMSVSAFIAKILDDNLKRQEPEPQRPFRLVTVGGNGVSKGIDLDKRRLLASQEDELAWMKEPEV